MGCSPILLQNQAYKSIALCCIHHYHHIYVHCYPEPNLPTAGVDSFSNLYMLVRKRKFKRENTQDIEIHKSNSKTVHSFQRQIEKRESWRRCQKLLKNVKKTTLSDTQKSLYRLPHNSITSSFSSFPVTSKNSNFWNHLFIICCLVGDICHTTGKFLKLSELLSDITLLL